MIDTKKLRYEKALNKFLHLLPDTGKVIDLQTRQDTYAKVFAQYEHEVYVVQSPHILVPLLQSTNKELIIPIDEDFDDIIFPYRTINGIWASKSFINFDKDNFVHQLSRLSDWLADDGVMYLCLLEGEGQKQIVENTPYRTVKRSIYYYLPEELESILLQADYTILDAWYEKQLDRRWIHVMIQKIG